MRTFALVLTGLLLLPTVLALPTPPVPPLNGTVPANAAVNGGFEDGLTGWRVGGLGGGISLVSPGAADTATALMSRNAHRGTIVSQPLPAPGIAGQSLVLDFYAKVPVSAGRTGINRIEAIANWNPFTGAGQATVSVDTSGTTIAMMVWDGGYVTANVTHDGAWHRFTAILAGPLGLGVLLMDGQLLLQATGDPLSVDPANVLILGDVAGCDCSGRGPAPDVAYDEVYLGPAV